MMTSPTPTHKGEELFQYIPQRPPFVMVDKVFEKGEDFLISGFDIHEGNPLVDNHHFQEGGLVENIAQTAALFAGIRFHEQDRETPLGYIAGIRNLVVDGLPAAGTAVHTRVTLVRDLLNIQLFEGEVYNEAGEKIAGCELRIFIKADEPNEQSEQSA